MIRRWPRWRLTNSQAIFIGGYVWLGARTIEGLGMARDPVGAWRVLAAAGVACAATATAGAVLLGSRRAIPIWEVCGYLMVPILVCLIGQPVLAVDEGRLMSGWWIGLVLPLLAIVAARWSLAWALVSATATIAASLAVHTAYGPWTTEGSVRWAFVLVQLPLWPIAGRLFSVMLGEQHRVSAEFGQARARAGERERR